MQKVSVLVVDPTQQPRFPHSCTMISSRRHIWAYKRLSDYGPFFHLRNLLHRAAKSNGDQLESLNTWLSPRRDRGYVVKARLFYVHSG